MLKSANNRTKKGGEKPDAFPPFLFCGLNVCVNGQVRICRFYRKDGQGFRRLNELIVFALTGESLCFGRNFVRMSALCSGHRICTVFGQNEFRLKDEVRLPGK